MAHTVNKVNEIVREPTYIREDGLDVEKIEMEMIHAVGFNAKRVPQVKWLVASYNLSTAFIARFLGVSYQQVYKIRRDHKI